MARQETYNRLQAETAEKYLSVLDDCLESLVRFLENRDPVNYRERLRTFGDQEKWDWERLPNGVQIDKVLSPLVRAVYEQYNWLAKIDEGENPENNRRWFDSIEISSDSGLPSPYTFIELDRIRKDPAQHLAKIADYHLLAMQVKDKIMQGAPRESIDSLRDLAMKRSFLEQISNANLLKWKKTEDHSLEPRAWHQRNMGVEELWSVAFVDYNLGSAQYAVYVIDFWQDFNGSLLGEEFGETQINPLLRDALTVSSENDLWYLLRKLDTSFETIHPVHATRGLVGPMECKFRIPSAKNPTLDPIAEVVREDPEAMILRFKRQYAFSPNHYETNGKIRQRVYQEDWHDEVIVAPSEHAQRISRGLQGDAVYVIER